MTTLPTSIKCPSCWHRFQIEQTVWIATSDDLREDQRLEDKNAFRRFLPRHFTPSGRAIDELGGECAEYACPRCHLPIPNAYFESSPFTTSIVGGSGTGKTFYLVVMTWWMKNYSSTVGLEFGDSFAELNKEYLEEPIEQFFPTRTFINGLQTISPNTSADRGQNVYLPKINPQAMLGRDAAELNDRPHTFIRPFVYSIKPAHTDNLPYSLCLYDHAGEDFWQKTDDPTKPLTMHLGFSDTLLFQFDPTQNLNFINAYKPDFRESDLVGKERDILKSHKDTVWNDPVSIFNEMARRIRQDYKKANNEKLRAAEKYDRPIIVVVTKCDAWKSLLPPEIQKRLEKDPFVEQEGKRPLSHAIIKEV